MQHPQTIGVVGLGFMGRGVASALVANGLTVHAHTRDEQTYAEARAHIADAIDQLIDRAGYPASLRDEWTQRYHEAPSPEDLAGCDFVVESITEDLAAKRDLFDRLEAVLAPDAVIASNTSALAITTLQEGRRHPERFIGMHWGEPCHVVRFLEVIRGEHTSDAAVAAALALARVAQKDPAVVQRDIDGFIVNRLGYAMMREAFHLLDTGVADAATIDRAFRNAIGLWATLCGPFQWIDLTGGLPLYAPVMQRMFAELCSDTELPPSIRKLAEAGGEGVKNGRGFYRYTTAEAQQALKRFTEHAWTVRELQNRYDPLDETPSHEHPPV